jgi:DNA polymerase sigma
MAKSVKMKVFKILIFLVTLFYACEPDNKPKDLIEEKKMILIMTDLHIMDGYMSTIIYSDTTKRNTKNLYATIYKTHKTTQKSYEESLKYYSRKPALLDTMYNKVQALIDEKEHKLHTDEISKPNRIQKQK